MAEVRGTGLNHGNFSLHEESQWRNKRGVIVYSIIFSALLLAGCSNMASYREAITDYQLASNVVIEQAREYYCIANKGERDAEIDRRVARGDEITIPILEDKDLVLLSPDGLAARMAALDVLAKHGLLLLTLANSDAPDKAKFAANSLKDAIDNLLISLGHAPSDSIKGTTEGFAAIASETVKLALEAKIEQALDKALTVSEQGVIALIQLLREEMNSLNTRQRSKLSNARVSAINEYNKELKRPGHNLEDLQKAASRIKVVEDAWESLPWQLGAGAGLDAMAQAQQNLIDFAQSSKKPQDLADLVEAMEAFVSRAKVIADAIQTIRDAKE